MTTCPRCGKGYADGAALGRHAALACSESCNYWGPDEDRPTVRLSGTDGSAAAAVAACAEAARAAGWTDARVAELGAEMAEGDGEDLLRAAAWHFDVE